MLCSVTVEAFGFIFIKWEEAETCHHSFYTFTLNLNMALSELWKRSHFHAGLFFNGTYYILKLFKYSSQVLYVTVIGLVNKEKTGFLSVHSFTV